MSGNHARLAPSSADRWVECPGSIQLSEGVPDEPDTAETLEGNAADWVAKQYAAGNEVAYGTPTPVPGYSVDYDMIHGAKLWAETVGYGAVSGVPVVASRIHPTDNWGEPDGWTWNGIERLLKLPDYKYGFDVHDPFEHWQDINYVAGILESLDLLTDPDVRVWLGIVQPRAWHKDGPVRWWKTDVGTLRAYFNHLRDAAMSALPWEGTGLVGVTPPTKTGPHCLHCPARHHCTTLQRAVSSAAQFTGLAQRTAMNGADLGTSLAIARDLKLLIDAYVTGLEAQAEGMLRAGQRIAGWMMDATPGRLAWHKDVTVAEIDGIGTVIEKTMRKPPTVHAVCVTPTQAINAGISKDVVMQYASTSNGGMKLVRNDGSEARKVFSLTT